MKKIKILIALLFTLFISQIAIATQLIVDTSSWNGITVNIAYDLIDGSPNSTIIDYGFPEIDGLSIGASGVLEDLFFYNTIEQTVNLGNQLIINFYINKVGMPLPNYFPDSFSIFLLAQTGLPLFQTTDPTGADSLLQWDIGSDAPNVYAGVLQDSNPVPEPGTLLLFFVGLGALAFARCRRLLPYFVGVILIVNSSIASAGVSLSTTTDLGTQLNLTASGLRLNRNTNTFDSVVQIKNISQQIVNLPVSIAVLSLPYGVILTNATVISDEGIPINTITNGPPLNAGSSTTLTLKFVNRNNQAFPISLRVVRLEQVVPNEELLKGPDSNHNGVRDDLEPVLDTRYSNDDERNSAIQVLKSMRNSLVTGSTESAFNAMVLVNKSFDCLFTVMGAEQGASEINFLQEQMMNTKERIKAWIDLSNKIAGQSIPVGTNNPCQAQ